MLPFLCIACLTLATPEPHPEMRAMLEASRARDPNQLIQADPLELQAIVNSVPRPSSGIELASVRDVTVPGGAVGVPCRLYHPDPETRLPLLVWMHGGGWVLGTLESADPEARFISVEGGIAVLSVGYRVAPQHQFPAAADDCILAVTWAIEHADELGIDPTRVAVGGDSAGGNLAASVSMSLSQTTIDPPIAAQFLVYPALDALADTPSRHEFSHGYFLESQHMAWFYDLYAPDHEDWNDARLSPLRAESFVGLPHAVILPAQLDLLRDEAVQYAVKLIEAGVGVDLMVAEGMPHGFVSMWMESPAAASEFRAGVDRLAAVLHGSRPDTASLLDTNMDGLLEPYEAADAILRMREEYEGMDVATSDMQLSAALAPAWWRQETDEIWDDLDANSDGVLEFNEVDESFVALAKEFDENKDGRVDRREFDTLDAMESDLYIEMEASSLMDEYDVDGDGVISRDEAQDDPELHQEADADGDGVATRDEVLQAMIAWEPSLYFEVEGDRAFAYGTIDGTTPGRIMELLMMHPEVTTLVLTEVPGSIDDHSSLRACRIIRRHGLATHVPADGEISSGGVDMFCSGIHRTADRGALIGVHSWGAIGESGDTTPRDDEAHDMYLEFGREMGLPDEFYWFTIESASPMDIHWMTPEELRRFGVLTDGDAPPMSSENQFDGLSRLYEFGIQPIDALDHQLHREGFIKEAQVMAPNGKPIRIIAQAGVPDIVVARARNLLRFFLTDVPGTTFGADKSEVANMMANNHAMLMIPRGAHRPGHEPDIDAQPLFRDETPVDGSRWYVTNDWEHRDAGFEEIFHLVHDAGIGTYMPGALPTYQAQLDREARAAIREGRWGIAVEPGVRDWIDELEQEDSLAQEYIASVIDSYYGLWGAFEEAPGGMWGIYIAKNRDEVAKNDPRGKELLESFLPPMMHGYEALIDPGFSGEFIMEFDSNQLYTHKSQYYVDATLTGDLNSSLRGNAHDNVLRGNHGDNLIRGGDGRDTVVFTGGLVEYDVEHVNGMVTIADTVAERDGTDRIQGVEVLRFADGEVEAGR